MGSNPPEDRTMGFGATVMATTVGALIAGIPGGICLVAVAMAALAPLLRNVRLSITRLQAACVVLWALAICLALRLAYVKAVWHFATG